MTSPQPTTLEDLEKQLSGTGPNMILYECGSCKRRFNTLHGLKVHVAHCLSPRKAPTLPTNKQVEKVDNAEDHTLDITKKAVKKSLYPILSKEERKQNKKLQSTLQQRAAIVASQSLQGKIQVKKAGASKFQCSDCGASFLGQQGLNAHKAICNKSQEDVAEDEEETTASNIQPFIAKIQQRSSQNSGQEPQDMIGLFIPIGMYPNESIGLPDMSAVTKLMQQKGPGTERMTQQHINEVMQLLPKNTHLKCEDCNKVFISDTSIEELEKHVCGAQSPSTKKHSSGEPATETIVLDEMQCKYCLRTVNQRNDLNKHYRFCLGLKGAKKTDDQAVADDPMYSLFSEEGDKDERLHKTIRKAFAIKSEKKPEIYEASDDLEEGEIIRKPARVYGRQHEDEQISKELLDAVEKEIEEEKQQQVTRNTDKDTETVAPEESVKVRKDYKKPTTPTVSKNLKPIVIEPREQKTQWKTIYVVPPICSYCKMQFRAYSSLKMHYRFCFYRNQAENVKREVSMPTLPPEKNGVTYMWPEEAARLFYTKCNFCHKRFASEQTRIRHMHLCPRRRMKQEQDPCSLADLKPTDRVRCTGCGAITFRSHFSQHLRGCRKRVKIPPPEGSSTIPADVKIEIITDDTLKEGEDFLKEDEHEKEGFLEKFGLLSKEHEEDKHDKGNKQETEAVNKQQAEQESIKEQQQQENMDPPEPVATINIKNISKKGAQQPKESTQPISGKRKLVETIKLMEAINENQQQLLNLTNTDQSNKRLKAQQERFPASKPKQSIKVIQKNEPVPDPKTAPTYQCPDCGVTINSHDGLRSHKLFCDRVQSCPNLKKSGFPGGGVVNRNVPAKLSTDIMPDCIYKCGYCSVTLMEGPTFKEHVMLCYEAKARHKPHDTIVNEILTNPELNVNGNTIPQLLVLTSKQITDKAGSSKLTPQPFIMFECTLCNKIVNTQTNAAKHCNSCQKTAKKKKVPTATLR